MDKRDEDDELDPEEKEDGTQQPEAGHTHKHTCIHIGTWIPRETEKGQSMHVRKNWVLKDDDRVRQAASSPSMGWI